MAPIAGVIFGNMLSIKDMIINSFLHFSYLQRMENAKNSYRICKNIIFYNSNQEPWDTGIVYSEIEKED